MIYLFRPFAQQTQVILDVLKDIHGGKRYIVEQQKVSPIFASWVVPCNENSCKTSEKPKSRGQPDSLKKPQLVQYSQRADIYFHIMRRQNLHNSRRRLRNSSVETSAFPAWKHSREIEFLREEISSYVGVIDRFCEYNRYRLIMRSNFSARC